MSVDVVDLRDFYESPLGTVAHRMVARVIGQMWNDLRGLRLVGIGFAIPYLPAIASECERALAVMPGRQGAVIWPGPAASATLLADPLILPLGDSSIDRVLVVHALETAEDPAEFVGEISRILVPGGRAILVCPNRRGLWARMDGNPFGQGQPFSRRQLRRLMRDTQLEPERWAETLYVPPIASGMVLRGAGAWERVGVTLSLPFAGLHVVEAAKQFQRPIPVRERRRRTSPSPVFVPVPAARIANEPGPCA